MFSLNRRASAFGLGGSLLFWVYPHTQGTTRDRESSVASKKGNLRVWVDKTSHQISYLKDRLLKVTESDSMETRRGFIGYMLIIYSLIIHEGQGNTINSRGDYQKHSLHILLKL